METPKPGTECRTLTDAYSRFGIAVSNPRTAWSAQSEDGTVVVTLWANRFDAARGIYDVFEDPTDGWEHIPPNQRRLAHLKHALANRGGRFESIIVFRGDGLINRIVRREIGPTMRIVDLRDNGQFRAERVSR